MKESQDDDDHHNPDPDQLPISNIGRLGSAAPSRSSSHNARVRGGIGSRPAPPVTRSSDKTKPWWTTSHQKSPLGSSFAVAGGVGSGSLSGTLEADEMDADADAEAEVESEAEAETLRAVTATSRDQTDGEENLEAVDAAEANSSSSHGGERMRMKSESWWE